MRLGRALVIAFVASAAACVIGQKDPGCADDGECPVGFSCRAGACFELTTSASPPTDPRDAGND